VLNRYWDDRATPREEAWKEDVATARASRRPADEVYRNLRAAAESGWDFSSRWLADARTLATIRTVEIVPPDLNSLLFNLEITLAKAYDAARRPDEAAAMRRQANARKAAIQRYLWDPRLGAFGDYLWREGRTTGHVTAATLYPLFFNVADTRQAQRAIRTARGMLLRADGVATTLIETGHQWDAPNGWPPLQWIAIRGLRNYGHAELAETIARRWIAENLAAFRASGKLVEKYDVTGKGAAGGGEYPLQDGFGWTNGVLRKLLALYPSPADCASGGRR
jgi:alpha,alpha-trehalase